LLTFIDGKTNERGCFVIHFGLRTHIQWTVHSHHHKEECLSTITVFTAQDLMPTPYINLKH